VNDSGTWLGESLIHNDRSAGRMNATTPVAAASNMAAGNLRRLAVAGLCAAVPLMALTQSVIADARYSLTDYFLWSQDLPILVALAAAWAALLISSDLRVRLQRISSRLARLRPWVAACSRAPWVTVFILAGVCLVVCVAGAFLSFAAYPLSMDEFMANFDAEIFRHGQPMAAVPAFWRPLAPALQPLFRLPTPDNTYWVSAYLPMNAFFRAAMGSDAMAHLVNPLWAAVSVIAIFGVARRLWPARPEIGLAAALLLATSSQFLVTAMTSYAMPGHLALNLVWLWLFLKGGRSGHAGAIVVAFAACGLHQLVFHPLFAAPFFLQLWLDHRRRLAIFYIASYAAICLFWIFYWSLALHSLGVALPADSVAGARPFMSQSMALLAAFEPAAATSLMAKNLIRFLTWQNPLVVPLAVVGGIAAMATHGVLRSLLIGIVLTIVAMFFILPYQGYGWGYRYVHGLLGSACLLAAFGWIRLVEGRPEATRSAAWTGFVVVTAGAALVLPPIRLLQMAQWVKPYAEASASIAHDPAQIVLVDETGVLFGRHLVRNDPYLRNRPLVFSLALLNAAQVRQLCARYTASVFDRASAERFGIVTSATGRPGSTSGYSDKLPAESRCSDHRRGDAALASRSAGLSSAGGPQPALPARDHQPVDLNR